MSDKEPVAPLEQLLHEAMALPHEKASRIRYQDICYKVANLIDAASPGAARRCVVDEIPARLADLLSRVCVVTVGDGIPDYRIKP